MTLNEQTLKRLKKFKKRYSTKRQSSAEGKAQQKDEKTYFELCFLLVKLPQKFSIKEAEKKLQLSPSTTWRKLRMMEICAMIKLVNRNPLTFIKSGEQTT